MKIDPNLRKQIAVDAIAAWLLECEDELHDSDCQTGIEFLNRFRDWKHQGDCMHEGYPCFRCFCEARLSDAEAIVEAVGAAAGGSE